MVAAGLAAATRAAMWAATCSASWPTPPIRAEVIEVRKNSPTK
jgi:hypothetical protein